MSGVYVLIEPSAATPAAARAAFARVEPNPAAPVILLDVAQGDVVKGTLPELTASWPAGGLHLAFPADERYCGGFVGLAQRLGDARVVVQAIDAPPLSLASQAEVAGLLQHADVVIRCAPALAARLAPLLATPVQACEALYNGANAWVWAGFRAVALAGRPAPYAALIEEVVFAAAATGRLGVVAELGLAEGVTAPPDDEAGLAARASRAVLVAAGVRGAASAFGRLDVLAREADARAEAATLRWLTERNRLFNLGARARWVPIDTPA